MKVARYEFLVKPLAAISQINSGIQLYIFHSGKKQSVQKMKQLYAALTATSEKVVEILESNPRDPSEERVMSYLEQFIGNMNKDMLRRFLRFTTGVFIEFNGLLELSSTYTTTIIL